VNRAYEVGLTSREVETFARVRAAHKRTSELLQDGLLRVVTRGEKAAGVAQAAAESCPSCRGFDSRDRRDHTHVVPVEDPGGDAVRGGGRILAITDDGRRELLRLNTEKADKDRTAAVKAERRRLREERRRARGE
jgi:hypothetical protein